MAATAVAEAYRYESFLPPQHEGIHAADEMWSREAIEDEAWSLIEQRDRVLKVEVGRQEYRDNARTALMEALTASGHLSTVEIHGTLEEINAQVLRRLLNGWDESLPEHEQARRFAEICNELYIQRVHRAIVQGELPPDTEVLEISDYPEALRGLKLGYRDSNRKGMVRSTGLKSRGNGQYTRVIEQVSRSNGTWQSTFGFLRACNVQTYAGAPDIAALKVPKIYSRHDYADGVVDVMRLLDRHAGWGVLYGDTGARTNKHPSYAHLRRESARREQEVGCFVDGLAALERQLDGWLDDGKITWDGRMRILKGEIMRVLDAICTAMPDYAEDTFGERSAHVFRRASVLVAHGDYEAAAQLLKSNNYLKETVDLCGVSMSVDEAQQAGVQVNSYEQLMDRLGLRTFTCPKGHVNFRQIANLKESRCQVCRTDVSCESTGPKKSFNSLLWELASGNRGIKHKNQKTAPQPASGNRSAKHSNQKAVPQLGKQALARNMR